MTKSVVSCLLSCAPITTMGPQTKASYPVKRSRVGLQSGGKRSKEQEQGANEPSRPSRSLCWSGEQQEDYRRLHRLRTICRLVLSSSPLLFLSPVSSFYSFYSFHSVPPLHAGHPLCWPYSLFSASRVSIATSTRFLPAVSLSLSLPLHSHPSSDNSSPLFALFSFLVPRLSSLLSSPPPILSISVHDRCQLDVGPRGLFFLSSSPFVTSDRFALFASTTSARLDTAARQHEHHEKHESNNVHKRQPRRGPVHHERRRQEMHRRPSRRRQHCRRGHS